MEQEDPLTTLSPLLNGLPRSLYFHIIINILFSAMARGMMDHRCGGMGNAYDKLTRRWCEWMYGWEAQSARPLDYLLGLREVLECSIGLSCLVELVKLSCIDGIGLFAETKEGF